MAKQTHIIDGIKVSLDPSAFDDCDVQELIEEGKIIGAIKAVMGEDVYYKAKEAIRQENGQARLTDMANWYAKCATEFGVSVKN